MSARRGAGAAARALLLVALVAVAGCGGAGDRRAAAPTDGPGTRMTAEEVRAALVGRPWKGAHGVYAMAPDGTYTYESTDTTIRWGPFPYTINADGTVTGASGTWTFYRIGSAYRYHSSDTGEFYLAVPVRQ